MTESNKQSNLLRSLAPSVAPEDYLMNKAKIAEAKALISAYEEMNEAGKQSHDEFARELEQKVREGEQARILLEQLNSQSTVQVPSSMPIQRPVIDYPSGTSRIEEVLSYDPGSGHSQQAQYHQFHGATSNQQTHNSVPQAMAQTVGSSSYQQLSSQQWTPANATNSGQSMQTPHQLYSQYSQQNVMQNSSSGVASYAPFGVAPTVRPQQHPTGQDRGKHVNYSRPMAPTQEQGHVPSHQEPMHYDITGSNQGQRHTATSPQVQVYLSPQTIPAQASGPSTHTTRAPQFAQQSSKTRKIYPQVAVSQNQATASGSTYPQWPQPHKTTNVANQSQTPVTNVAASRPVALGLQSNASSSADRNSSPNSTMFSRPTGSVPVVVGSSNLISTNPQTNPKDGGASLLNQGATGSQQTFKLIAPTTLPSRRLDPTQYIREFREAIKTWGVNVPPNSYFDHLNSFTVFKDDKGVTRIVVRNNGQPRKWDGDVDDFCNYWLHCQNVTPIQQPSTTPTVPANSQSHFSSKQMQSAMAMSMHNQGVTLSNTQKAIPSTVHKVNAPIVQTTSPFSQSQSQFQSKPAASLSKQSQPDMSTSIHNQGTNVLTHQISSTSTTQPLSSTSRGRPLPLSTMQTTPSVSVPETPSRQLSTVTNGVPRSVKQADKKFLASHILFGLGKRPREPDTSPTALAEPQPKRHAQQDGVSPSASFAFGPATQAAQKPDVPLQITPIGASTVSSSWQQTPHHTIPTSLAIPQETQQTSQASASASSGGQRQLVDAALEVPFTRKVAAAASTEVPEVPKPFSDQTPWSLQDASIVQASLPDKQKMQTLLSVVQPDSKQEITLDDHSAFSGVWAQSRAAASVPLATPSAMTQTATLSPVPLTAPVAVSLLLSSAGNENAMQPVASSSQKRLPQPDVLGKSQRSLNVTSPVPSPLDSMAPTSAQTSQKNQPLFLPSPVSSPGIDVNDDISISKAQSASVASPSFDGFDLRKSSSSAKRKNRAYVLVPPRPEYLVRYWRLEKQKASLKRIRMTSRSSVSTSVAGEEDFYNAPENHSPSCAYEQQAAQLACSRLQELSCKWDGCSVKMNSVDALIGHLNRQHKPSSTSHNNSFLCRWTQCGRRCNLRERHLEKHASLALNCPYEDCDKSFRSAPPLWKHMRTEHENGKLKPSTEPFDPKLKPLDAIPGVIPSYMITTRRVKPIAISSERHAVAGPWVLRNIAGLQQERLTRQKSKKTVRSSNGDLADEDTNNDYDFLTTRPTRYSSHLSQPVDMKVEDLNSENISKMVDEGLTLWGVKEEPNRTPSPAGSHVGSDSPTLGRREHRSDQDEVEKMLTELMVA